MFLKLEFEQLHLCDVQFQGEGAGPRDAGDRRTKWPMVSGSGSGQHAGDEEREQKRK